MPERATIPHLPSLPPELWIRILTFNPSPTHLWTSCRHVSHTFRDYTEQVFAETIIRNTYIDFILEKYNLGGKSKRPEVPTSFSHFSWVSKASKGKGKKQKIEEDLKKNLVYFKDHRPKKQVGNGKPKEYTRIIQRWSHNIRTRKPELPNYTLRIGTLVNDTALPDLALDESTREISFDWRKTYTLFFREQALYAYLKAKWQSSTAAQIQLNNARIAKREKLHISDYPVPWASAELEIRKQIRRKRLRECYPDNEEMLWAIDSLSHFENHGGGGGGGGASEKKAFRMNPELPGAGLGERWFGSVNVVQGLYLDEWSCMHRIDTKGEHVRGEEVFPRFSVPPPELEEEGEGES